MDIALEDLVDQWRGQTVRLDVVIAHHDDGAQRTIRYDGILDGPYVGDEPGVSFMLGSSVIGGDIAIRGPFVSFEPARADDRHAPVVNDAYLELRVFGLPLTATVEGGTALWDARLADGSTVRCCITPVV